MTHTRTVTLRWIDGLRFEGGAPDGPSIPVDGDNATAPGPMQQLLLAIGACSGSDVVSILAKSRIELTRCEVTLTGTRREEPPRRYVAIHLVFRLAGRGLDDAKARRAIDLSVTKYCSVIHSLNPDIPVTYEYELG